MYLAQSTKCGHFPFQVFVFEERGKPEYPAGEKPLGGREPTTNSTHI